MSHLDSSTLATYNSLVDPHLQCYFSNERIRSHLKHAGLISRRGEIVSDSEYRLKLTRREHKKHVRQMLAENIVHRAIDMERLRQAELKRQLDMVTKAALVNSVKESRRRGGHISNSTDMGLLSMHSSWSQIRPKSANHDRQIEIMNEEFGEQTRAPRVHSAHVNSIHRTKNLSKSPNRRYLNRPKSSNIHRTTSLQRPRSPIKSNDTVLSNSSCRVTMIYYGPHTKVDYDHSIFEPVDEIIVMQQHCGGENLIVYKNNLKAGDEFSFNSHRHANYPFGLSLYVKGLIDSRISTCCEYKHRHGVRLGGERGHFAIVSVEGSKPCLKCRFEKQARLKQYADSPKDLNETDDENKKPIIISLPVSDEPKARQTPVKISVKRTPDLNENYSEDFDGSDDVDKRKNDYSSDTNEKKIKTGESSTKIRRKSPTETSSTSTVTSKEKSLTKTWQITFHTTNIPTGSLNLPKKSTIDAILKFSYFTINEDDETEQYEIEIKDFPQCFKSGRQDSFRAKLRNIGQPKKIRLILEITGNDDDDDNDIKWHLDHIELIDPETQSHYKFSCNQWIYPSQEKIFNLSEPSQQSPIRKSSISSKASSSSSQHKKPSKQSPKKLSSRSVSSSSSSSSYASPQRYEIIQKLVNNQNTRRISTDNESYNEKNKIHYRIIIYPSDDDHGEFNALNDSRIFIRLNNQTKDSYIYKKSTKYCPSFESGENQTFDIDLIQDINEKPNKLTIGYYNSDITAGKWNLQKIILINTETNEKTLFICNDSLVRSDFNLRAEKTFLAQTTEQSDDDDQQSTPRNIVNVVQRPSSSSESDENDQPEQVELKANNQKRTSSSSESKENNQSKSDELIANNQKRLSKESLQPTTITTNNNEKPSSKIVYNNDDDDDDEEDNEDNEYNRMFKNNKTNNNEKPLPKIVNNDDDDDDDDENNEYNRMFKNNKSDNKEEIDPSSSRPKTRRGVQNSFEKDNEQEHNENKIQTNSSEIWRPPSEMGRKEPVDPLIGLDELQEQTSRSNEQKNQHSSPSTNTNNTENNIQNWYPKTEDDDED